MNIEIQNYIKEVLTLLSEALPHEHARHYISINPETGLLGITIFIGDNFTELSYQGDEDNLSPREEVDAIMKVLIDAKCV